MSHTTPVTSTHRPILKYTLLDPRDTAPDYGSEGAIGLDLRVAGGSDVLHVMPGLVTTVPTGLRVEIPAGFYGRIAPRSGLAAKHGVDVLAGVIDSDYRGEIKVLLTSFYLPVSFHPGEKIAQLILERAERPELQYVDALGESARGAAGFGSTGTR